MCTDATDATKVQQHTSTTDVPIGSSGKTSLHHYSLFRTEVESHTEGSADQDKDTYKTVRLTNKRHPFHHNINVL